MACSASAFLSAGDLLQRGDLIVLHFISFSAIISRNSFTFNKTLAASLIYLTPRSRHFQCKHKIEMSCSWGVDLMTYSLQNHAQRDVQRMGEFEALRVVVVVGGWGGGGGSVCKHRHELPKATSNRLYARLLTGLSRL